MISHKNSLGVIGVKATFCSHAKYSHRTANKLFLISVRTNIYPWLSYYFQLFRFVVQRTLKEEFKDFVGHFQISKQIDLCYDYCDKPGRVGILQWSCDLLQVGYTLRDDGDGEVWKLARRRKRDLNIFIAQPYLRVIFDDRNEFIFCFALVVKGHVLDIFLKRKNRF